MTYWNVEHEQNLRRIGDMLRDLDALYEDDLPTLMRELRDDDEQACEFALAWLAGARKGIAEVMGRLEHARDALPEPKTPQIGEGPTGPTPLAAAHDDGEHGSTPALAAVPPSLSEPPTAADVMERDG